MYTDVHTANTENTVAEALKYMKQHKTNSLIITDAENKPVGIVSSQILIRAAVPEYLQGDPVYSQYGPEGTMAESLKKIKDRALGDLMYTEFHTLTMDDVIIEAASYSVDSYRRILPVINDDGTLAGAITRTCIKNAMYDTLFEHSESNTTTSE